MYYRKKKPSVYYLFNHNASEMMDNIEEKIKIDLGEVQKTLLMPLWGRAREYEDLNPLIKDKFALEITDRLDYDFLRISESFDEYYQKYWATRAYNIDCALLSFINSFPDATIVNIGAGLDTTFQRVDNGKIVWYDLDLADTIRLRRALIPETERNRFISKSVFDRSWYDDIQIKRSRVFFVASGVLCYFDENSVRNLFLDLIENFPESEIIFEIMSKMLIRLSNRKIGRDKAKVDLSPVKWGTNSSKSIKKWSNKIRVIDEYPVFSRINIDKTWGRPTIGKINHMNFLGWVKMVHLKFSNHE